MSTGHRIRLGKGYRLKTGKLVHTNTYKDVSARLRERGSKRVRVVQRRAISTALLKPKEK
jgi:hypothetical protein